MTNVKILNEAHMKSNQSFWAFSYMMHVVQGPSLRLTNRVSVEEKDRHWRNDPF